MKTYKLKGLEYYMSAFSIEDAVILFLANNIGVTAANIEETDIEPNRDAIGRVFMSLEEYQNFEFEY